MNSRDRRAIRAATNSIGALNWIVDNPGLPVPTHVIRPAMESFADYVIDRLTEALFFAVDLQSDEAKPARTDPQQPDSIPEMGS